MNHENSINPVIPLDYPDPDVIRVGDTYYMASTTMHFMPGCALLRSYDLVHWELASYVYEVLEDTPGQRLEGEENAYGHGMWAPSLRYHEGTFYLCFVANDTGKTYLFCSRSIKGPWERREIRGFYHDCSLLFDDDGRVYIVYGNNQIHLTELEEDLSGPKKGGLDRVIVEDKGNLMLGYEGAHMYKISGRYYVFFIHSLADRWRRVEACFAADSLEGEFAGKDVLNDDMGYRGQGVAQGGIVDTPEGKWFAVLFQDRGAVGRLPVLVPVRFEKGFPVFGEDNRVPGTFPVSSTRPDYACEPLYTDDDFRYVPDEEGRICLKLPWQWNHIPDARLWRADRGRLEITTEKVCANVCMAANTLTQRMIYPGCRAWVRVDGSGLQEGDVAGICALQGCYGLIGLRRKKEGYELVMMGRPGEDGTLAAMEKDLSPGVEYELREWKSPEVTLMVRADFYDMRDRAEFFYQEEGRWRPLGVAQQLFFKLDHFCGCRVGLFCFSTKTAGGTAGFSDFCMRVESGE